MFVRTSLCALLLLLACQPEGGTVILPVSYQARCDGACEAPMSCLEIRDERICTRACGADADCTLGGTCAPEGLCVGETGRVADACGRDDDCHPGLSCYELPLGGFCTRPCAPGDPCPTEGENACIRLSNDAGTYCLRRCLDADHCGDGLQCTLLQNGAFSVCFP